ncbi:NAD-glutamate dehydrogenase [Nocardia cyriacigeorgica]|uniref:NAD-glutamate dehydrogenase n=1 Tax=Nocardia cyriacigeorgica TaxID=135487 RepID=UPI0018936AAA|nr:NAD-glutamate dehydrogenase [Nocardia cyriacigeorgica]MBF6093890.1 NAD-glutamate dehydrogenase [Nocardia cyriacigeorgica]MBF6158033.1 NAD-glutamate dehydrogenase [Nocardia cyriacigeorgica]MBF6197005.1 NAD-glutamate dehydrogenase [Nocardia cyriacigeorgica]
MDATQFRGDPTELEPAYFRWIRPDSTALTITDRAGHILRHHLELAARRAPGTVSTRVYRADDDCGLGLAIQIVNDDMPLLVESVTSALHRLGATVAEVVHPVFDVTRDENGELRAIAARDGDGARRDHTDAHSYPESWIHVQLDPAVSAETLDRIEQALPQVLSDLRSVTDDTPAMVASMTTLADRLDRTAEWSDDAEISECARLLRWLADGHFTVLGYSDYRMRRTSPTPDSEFGMWPVPGTGLGVLRDGSSADIPVPVLGAKRPVLRLTNGTVDSLIPGSPDLYFISVAEYATTDPGGAGASGDTVAAVKGEHVFVGTFTVTGLHENILDIPVISRRVHQVIEWAGFELNSFSGQAMLEVMQTFPRVELFSTDARRLFDTVSAVMNLGLRRQIRLFLRQDGRSGAIYCLVYMPRDRYSTEVRLRMQDILLAEFAGDQISYSARVTESELAVVYFTVHRAPGTAADLSEANRERVQDILFATTRTWSDRVVAAAAGVAGVSRAVATDYATAFPASYQQEFGADRALTDLRRLERLGEGEIDTVLYRLADAPAGEWRFTLYVAGAGVSLSRVLPVLHSLGVEVVDERPYRIARQDGPLRWIYDFALRVPAALLRESLDPDMEADLLDPAAEQATGIRQRFPAAFAAMWFGDAEVDGLNELVLRAGVHWRQIAVLRAYAKYLQQAGFAYTFGNITRVLLAHPGLAAAFIELFDAYFDPEAAGEESASRVEEISQRLRAEIDAVVSLDTDRILRAVLELITATLRTNYFRRDEHGEPAGYLSFKFDPQAIAELPQPRPRFEIFVYSPRVEGVHLRFGAVARGGLRWSDRLEDFRTEILGLVKAQAVKNAVIVPVGAKGGFVVKQPPAATGDAAADRQAMMAEGVACYRTFISGLLDLTDNVDHTSGAVLPPARVVRRDGDDTYLVVAADKGTATFSDIANDVAKSYGFWLGDAFASGGSVGYDHKAMGITARGAWESVKRHFQEMGIDTQTEDFTVVGIGDMSGDVFGNGMLLSEHIRLVAAFDHRHIFLDPNPDAASSFAERRRLFELPRSSWADYDKTLISEGGGVYDRSAKAVPVSAQVRQVLGLPDGVTTMSPPEMIRAILRAPVDLLWNGGIGTYIKASTESHADAGDKSNDAVRVDADQLRTKVIGEGGNLGATALGRIEFCRNGGRMNTDALDNSAGVDCSDHEVNIKVLLDAVVSGGELEASERNELLAAMTDEVAELVLRDNISQNFRMGLCRAEAATRNAVHRRLLTELETRRGVDRRLEALPSDAELAHRAAEGTGLTSPELANVVAHVKLSLKADVLAGDLPDSAAFAATLPDYFPTPLRSRFDAAIRKHPLRREIVATMVVNDLVDYGGITYAFRLAEEVGATTDDAVRAFSAAVEIFGLRQVWQRIRTAPIPSAARDALELETGRTLERASRWLLLNRPQPIAIGADIARYRDGVTALAGRVSDWLPGYLAEDLTARSQRAIALGAPPELATEVYRLIHLFPLLDVLDIADIAERDADEVAVLYFALNEHLDIERLLTAVGNLEHGDRWPTLARLAVRDDLYESLRLLTLDVSTATEPDDTVAEKIEYWESTNRSRLARAAAALGEIFDSGTYDLATLSVAARQVRGMVSAGGESSVVTAGAAS